MPPNELSSAEAVLHGLLDRFESPRQRVRDITQTIDYRSIKGPDAQDDFHRVLKDAERCGAIALEQERIGRFTGEYARVRLIDADKLYQFLARTPANVFAQSARQSISSAIPDVIQDDFFAGIEEEAFNAWKLNKSYLGYGVNDVNGFAILLRLAHGIAHLSGSDIDHRTFSRRIVKDSKALERCETRLAQLLKMRFPNLTGTEPREILEELGIVRRAHLLQVKGPLRLQADGVIIAGSGDSFIGLPWSTVQKMTVFSPVEYIIAIENPTSFWRYCTEISGNYMALLTDGFPARDVLASIVHLVRVASEAGNAPLYHWGDIDAGGLRIAAHLEQAIGQPIRLHDMTPALAKQFGSKLQSRKGLDQLASRDDEIGALARWLSSDEAMALEQEELDPRRPATTETNARAG